MNFSGAAGSKSSAIAATPLRSRWLGGLCLLTCLWASGSFAEPRFQSCALLFENDAFANTDEGYSTGLRLAVHEGWQLSEDAVAHDERGWREKLVDALPLCGDDSPRDCYDFRVGYALSQLTYTPENLSRSELILDDRPYGGWLSASLLLQLFGGKDDDRYHGFELSLGIVGPSSQAQEIQTFTHKILGSEEPRGWDNQLKDEGILQLNYRYHRRLVDLGEDRRWFDLTLDGGAGLGNAFVFAAAGATARIGYNLGDFVAGRIDPSNFDEEPTAGRWEAYLFASVQARAVGRNIFLDGNTFRDSHSVDREPFVNHTDVGLAVRYRRWTLTYRAALRSPEFEGGRQHEYGSFQLAYDLAVFP